jgi:hypothetical protein
MHNALLLTLALPDSQRGYFKHKPRESHDEFSQYCKAI